MVDNYVYKWYSKDIYMKTYKHLISPINGIDMWPQSTKPPLLAPVIETQLGRKQTKRRKETDEKVKLSKQKVIMH